MDVHKKNKHILRTTRSVCPVCCREVKAEFVVKGTQVVMNKKCPEHGSFSILISKSATYFQSVMGAYYALIPADLPVHILEIVLTPRCSMGCPMCSVMCSIGKASHEMTINDIKKIISDNPQKEFILWGMEPTEHPQIELILALFRKHKKIVHLFTNGRQIADIKRLRVLKNAGLSHVYLQFDGFNEEVYLKLRGQSLAAEKIQVLENLKELNISTTLNVTLAKGLNEHQIPKIISFALENPFIRQIGFLPLIQIGDADRFDKAHIPHCHEFLEIIERQTQGLINLKSLRAFQKLMYVVYRFAKFRRCFWFTLYALVRDRSKKTCRAVHELVDLKKIEKIIDAYVANLNSGNRVMNDIVLMIRLGKSLINRNTLPLIGRGLRFMLSGKKVQTARSGSDILFITCTDFCDFYKMDLDMSDKYCEELLALKSDDSKIIYKPTYEMAIQESRGK